MTSSLEYQEAFVSIDPGPIYSAWTKWQKGLPVGFGYLENSRLIEWLMTEILFLSHVAVEGVSSRYGFNQGSTVYETLIIAGRCQQVAMQASVPFTLVPPNIKQIAICGRIKGSTKARMNDQLKVIYGGKGTKKEPGLLYGISNHMWSSLAVGHTFKRLYLIGDLDCETTIPDWGAPQGLPRERRKAESPAKQKPAKRQARDKDALVRYKIAEGSTKAIDPARLSEGKCRSDDCQGTDKPGSCKCGTIVRRALESIVAERG